MAVILVRSLMAEGGCYGLLWASFLVLKRRTNLNKIFRVMRLWRVLYLIACKIKDGEAYSGSLTGILSSVFSYQDFAHTSFDIVTSTVNAILLWSNDYNTSFPTPPCTIVTMNEPFLASSSDWHHHRSNSIAKTEKKRYPRRPQHQLYSSKNNHDIMCISPT